MSRPFGVTLLGILSLIAGAWGAFKGLLWLGIGGAISFGLSAAAHPIAGAMVGIAAVIFGVIALTTGVFALIFAFGAFGLKGWAWLFRPDIKRAFGKI